MILTYEQGHWENKEKKNMNEKASGVQKHLKRYKKGTV